MNVNISYIESFLSIYLFKYGSFLALNLNTDKLNYLLEEEFSTINSILNDSLKIYMNSNNDIFVNFNNDENIDRNILKSVDILTWWVKIDLLTYIKEEFSKDFYNKIYPFFEFIKWDRYTIIKKIDFIEYASKINNFKLKKMLLFIHYWIANDSRINTLKSIRILTEVMDKYPNFASFYLLRMRQRFNLIYKILIWVSKFNKLISTEKWKEFLLNYAWIKECFDDLEKANNLLTNYYIYYFFKWKFLLHLFNKSWLDDLLNYEKLKWISFDTNVTSWFWVYYLQIWDTNNARKYLEKAHYPAWDRYKEYSKLVFLYIKSENKKDFLDFIYDENKRVEVLLFNEWNYYKYNNWILENWIDIDDSYDHRTKMWYKLNNFNSIINNKYSSKEEYFNNIFNNISRNYYDHWDTELQHKVIFYSYDSYTMWEKVFLQKHEDLVKK